MSRDASHLVAQMHEWLNAPWTREDAASSVDRGLAELDRRVRRLRRLGDRFNSVRLSGHIEGLRAASIPNRAGGVASPGTV